MQAASRLNSGHQIRLDRIYVGTPLNDLGIVQLLGLQWSLLSTSLSFYIQAAQVTLADADSAASQITAATNDANASDLADDGPTPIAGLRNSTRQPPAAGACVPAPESAWSN